MWDGLHYNTHCSSCSASVAGGQSVTFAGMGGNLTLRLTQGFAAAISGFGSGDRIDLLRLGGGSSGTLQMTAGGQHAWLTLLGNYTSGGFALAGDGAGGTLVKFTCDAAQRYGAMAVRIEIYVESQ